MTVARMLASGECTGEANGTQSRHQTTLPNGADTLFVVRTGDPTAFAAARDGIATGDGRAGAPSALAEPVAPEKETI